MCIRIASKPAEEDVFADDRGTPCLERFTDCLEPDAQMEA